MNPNASLYAAQTRRALLLLVAVALSATLLQLALSPLAHAQDKGEPLQISGLTLDNLSAQGKGAILRIKTRDGRPIPQDQIIYNTRGDVLRITFKDVPLEARLGLDVSLDTTQIRGIQKGYALKENNWQSFARLKFNGDAQEALKDAQIVPVDGGVELRFPFGESIAAAPVADAAPKAPAPHADEPAQATGGAFGWARPNLQGAANNAGAAPARLPEPAPMADDEPAPIAAAAPAPAAPTEPVNADIAAPTPIAQGTPLVLNDETRGPSITRLLGALAVVVMLLLAMAFLWRKLQQLKGAQTGLRIPADGVRVLSTYDMGRQARVMVVDILGEVLVVGQGATGLSLLHRMAPERVKELKNSPEPRLSEHEGRSLLNKLLESAPAQTKPLDTDTRAALEQVTAAEGSLEELSRSLDTPPPRAATPPRKERPKQDTTTTTAAPIIRAAVIPEDDLFNPEDEPIEPVIKAIRTDAAASTAGGDKAPVSFQEALRRRATPAQEPEDDTPSRVTTRRELLRMEQERLQRPNPREDIVSIRDRARSMGRL